MSLTDAELDQMEALLVDHLSERELSVLAQAREANALRAENAHLKECLAQDGAIITEHVDARREAERETSALRSTAAQLTNHQRALAEAKKEIERLRAFVASITVGPLDPFNRPQSRIHRALDFARQHGYHETDAAFAELHGLRERITALESCLRALADAAAESAQIEEWFNMKEPHDEARRLLAGVEGR